MICTIEKVIFYTIENVFKSLCDEHIDCFHMNVTHPVSLATGYLQWTVVMPQHSKRDFEHWYAKVNIVEKCGLVKILNVFDTLK